MLYWSLLEILVLKAMSHPVNCPISRTRPVCWDKLCCKQASKGSAIFQRTCNFGSVSHVLTENTNFNGYVSPVTPFFMLNWFRRGRREYLKLKNKRSYQQLSTESVTSRICASADMKLSSSSEVPCSKVGPQFCCCPPKVFPSPERVAHS